MLGFGKLLDQAKSLGNLLEQADEVATQSDLHALTKGVASTTFEAAKIVTKDTVGKMKMFDLGLKEGISEFSADAAKGLSELRGQSLVGAAGSAVRALDDGPAATSQEGTSAGRGQRLADLKERIGELEAREEERLHARQGLQLRLDEVSREAEELRRDLGEAGEGQPRGELPPEGAAAGAAPPAPGVGAHDQRLEAMRRELWQHQADADARGAALEAELCAVSAACEPLLVELEFWREQSQRLLAARGLDQVPEDVRALAERGACAGGQAHRGAADAGAPASRGRDAAQERLQQLTEDRDAQQRAYESLGERLEELMRGSDAAMGRVDVLRREERELKARLAEAEASATGRTEAASATEARVQALRLARAGEERRATAEAQNAREERRAAAPAAAVEAAGLRRGLEALLREVEGLSQENAGLESRLRKHRASAAADLERAVPLFAPGWWQGVDGATMKIVMLLVRSQCLRRAFVLHLLATYLWLFFLIFWLEKHP
ncbi:unnamed protein product [Prorocentrum cordatum]|uniref:Protein CASP n=1 Tax=Prorocentrum cordatum TaxID=2364126 RepID=A0ABN9PZ93_9DINO|nr:unnamed protein product [Polarella glacialis]